MFVAPNWIGDKIAALPFSTDEIDYLNAGLERIDFDDLANSDCLHIHKNHFCIPLEINEKKSGYDKLFSRAVLVDLNAKQVFAVSCLTTRPGGNSSKEVSILKRIHNDWSEYIQTYAIIPLSPGRYRFIQELFFCDGHEFMQNSLQKTKFRHLVKIACQLAKQVNTLHSFGIAHRDIKLENILIGNSRSPYSAVLVDFGMSSLNEDTRRIEGTKEFWPPEIWEYLANPFVETSDFKWDIWSLGIVYASFFSLFGDIAWSNICCPETDVWRKTLFIQFGNGCRLDSKALECLLTKMSLGFPITEGDSVSVLLNGMLKFNLFDRIDAAQVQKQCENIPKRKK